MDRMTKLQRAYERIERRRLDKFMEAEADHE